MLLWWEAVLLCFLKKKNLGKREDLEKKKKFSASNDTTHYNICMIEAITKATTKKKTWHWHNLFFYTSLLLPTIFFKTKDYQIIYTYQF